MRSFKTFPRNVTLSILYAVRFLNKRCRIGIEFIA